MTPRRLLNVFVVDDEPVIVKTVAALLRIYGFLVSPFTNPLEVLKRAQFGAPDLLISDVMMPQLSGIELAIRMKDLFPCCKVLLFSGYGSGDLMLESAQAKGYDFKLLPKPVYPKDLLGQIRQIGVDRSFWAHSAVRRERAADWSQSRAAL